MEKARNYFGRLTISVMILLICLTVCASESKMLSASGLSTEDNTSWMDYASSSFESGTGTKADPYVISSAEQMAFFAKNAQNYSDCCIKLAENIDLAAHEWVPISSFGGHFDGDGYSITGVWIGTEENPADVQYAGVFGYLKSSSVIENLILTVNIYTNYTSETLEHMAGAVAGYTTGSIKNCVISGSIHASSRRMLNVGGIAGRVRGINQNVLIINCGNYATVSGYSEEHYARAGGVIGAVDAAAGATATVSVVHCYNTADVKSGVAEGADRPRAAGIVGGIIDSNTPNVVAMHNCYNTGAMEIISTSTSNGKGTTTIASIANDMGGNWTNSSYLYGLSGTAVKTERISFVKTCMGESSMELEDMQAAVFVNNLNGNANQLVADKVCNGLLEWKVVDGSTPVLSEDFVTGLLTRLTVTVNSELRGSVSVAADETGGTNYIETGTDSLLEKGSNIKVTFIPSAQWYGVTELLVNGSRVDEVSDSYEFILNEDTKIEATYEVIKTVDVDAIYVNPTAKEQGDGTEFSPFKTLEQAKIKMENLLETTPNANITVYLMGGTYRLDETFILGESLASMGSVCFKNYKDEIPVITSGKLIETGAFTQVNGKGYYSYQLPDSAKVSLEGDQVWPQFRDLIVDGERAEIARTEDFTFKHTYANSTYSGLKVTDCDNLLYISPEVLGNIENDNLGNLEIGQLVEWKSQIFHIGSITGEKLDGEIEITIDEDEWQDFYKNDDTKRSLAGRVYWLQNHINFLDTPGEFYYDQTNGIIYYYPYEGQDMTDVQIEYATLDILIDIQNTSNITFDGISFTGTTANYITENGLITQFGCTLFIDGYSRIINVPCAAIHGDTAEGIRVQNCTFEELGGSAMVFDYGIKDIQITGNSIRNIAMVGIKVGQYQLAWNQYGLLGACEDVVINNNYITNNGLLVSCSPAISVAKSENLTIRYNTIVHVPYSGISAGWGFAVSSTDNKNLLNVDIAYNFIEDYMYKINDGGAIYVCGANDFITNTEYFNEIHHNYIRSGAHNTSNTGIYHDGAASNWKTYSNVVDGVKSTKGPMFFQDDVTAQNTHNILAENNYTTISMIFTSATSDRNITLRNNTVFTDRSEFNEEALAIMEGAGLQEAYKGIEKPMDMELRITDNTIHYAVYRGQTVPTEMNIELTNNSNGTRTFTISLLDELPKGVTCVFSREDITLTSGEIIVVTATFEIADLNEVVDSQDCVVGFLVKDTTERTELYPRAFTVRTVYSEENEIAYGTPVIDGVMDEAYLNSSRTYFGSVFYPNTGAESDVTGYSCMLWDEQYLYCYIYVEESTVMSRGIDFIASNCESGTHGVLWETDAVETYLRTSLRSGTKMTKFAVDAFGIRRFGNDDVDLVEHDLPYATAFTYNGKIIEGLEIKNPKAGQMASTAEQPVNGYVVEMVLPLTKDTHIENGTPKAGDKIEFYIQNNDYQRDDDGKPYVVAKANAAKTYILKGITEEGSDSNLTDVPVPDNVKGESENGYGNTTENGAVIHQANGESNVLDQIESSDGTVQRTDISDGVAQSADVPDGATQDMDTMDGAEPDTDIPDSELPSESAKAKESVWWSVLLVIMIPAVVLSLIFIVRRQKKK